MEKEMVRHSSKRRRLVAFACMTCLRIASAAKTTVQDDSILLTHPRNLGRRLGLFSSSPLPIKVFILAGDDACEGYGSLTQIIHERTQDQQDDKEAGTAFNDTERYYSHLLDPDDPKHLKWRTYRDVIVTYDHFNNEPWVYGPLRIDAKDPSYGHANYQFGPEVEFGTVLKHVYVQEPIIIIKAAWSGRSLYKDFLSPSGKAAASDNRATGFQYYRILTSVRRTLDSLSEIMPRDIQEYVTHPEQLRAEVVGMVWFHGYSDLNLADDGDSDPVDNYQANLQYLIQDLRDELNLPKLPLVIAQMGGQGMASNVSQAELDFRRMQQRAADSIPNAKLAETASLMNPEGPFREENIYHGQADSMIRIGGALAEAMLEMLYGTATPSPRKNRFWKSYYKGSTDESGIAVAAFFVTIVILVILGVVGVVLIRSRTRIGRWRRSVVDSIYSMVPINEEYDDDETDDEGYDDDDEEYEDDDGGDSDGEQEYTDGEI